MTNENVVIAAWQVNAFIDNHRNSPQDGYRKERKEHKH